MKNKILVFDELIKKIQELKKQGKTIVQTHGIFDLIHPGVIAHLNSAKTQGDVLVVTVVKDKDVRKGQGRPVFSENLRLANVASLEQIDYVCLVDDEKPFQCIARIKPDIFAKGQTYQERDSKIHEKIFKEEKELIFGRTKIYETTGFSFSSSQIINNFLNIYPEETKLFLKGFSRKYNFDLIREKINSLKDLKILIIGDGIVDEYHYCDVLGKSGKAMLIVNKYLTHEVFAGGAFAIANHLSGLCNDVHLVSLLGNHDSREDFILNNLKSNIKTKFFYRDDAPTIIKKRYLNQYLNQKLFEVNYLNDNYINGELETEIIEYLKSMLSKYDLVLISDFGHGFITDKIIHMIQKSSVKFAVNTQTNGANAGYNMITKYNNPVFVCLDETEVRLATQERFTDMEEITRKIAKKINSAYFIVTRGKNGSLGVNKNGETNRTPIFSTKVVDTVGAGDAFFAYTAPCAVKDMPLDLVSFIGNAVGAIAVQIVCNKRPVGKNELLELIYTLLKQEEICTNNA
ncbi:MAG: PfkB family carbohydrate kinase [Elusimicrobiota bacterium]